MRNPIIPAALILAMSGVPLISGCGRGEDKAGASEGREISKTLQPAGGTEAAVRVGSRAVEERSFQDVVTAPGQWRSAGEVVIGAPFAGAVDSLLVQPGDRVRQGQVLCRLVTRESRAALHGAEMMARQAHSDASRAEAARALELARREMIRVPILAPRTGVVADVSVQSGSEIAESAEILAIQAPDAIVFEARIDPLDSPRIHGGEPASIVERGHAEARAAVVQRTLPVAGASDQATLVWLAPRATAGSPPEIDRFGTATIQMGAARRAPAVPDSAVVQDDLTGETRVAVIDPDRRAVWTPVTLGAGAAGWHELRSPKIAPGTLVITQGQRGLPDSARVEPGP